MHERTPAIAKEVRRAKSLGEKTALLRDRYRGETCVIVTCGPSLASVPEARLREGLNGVLTIAVKQATKVTGIETDFHCWNSFNVSRFAKASPATMRCLVADPTGRIPQWNRYDMALPQTDGKGGLENSLAFRRDFAQHLIADDLVRPFGPGIMYELVLYLAVHLGVSKIITVGWDIANVGGKNTHFYDSRDDKSFFEKGRVGSAALPPARDPLPESVRYAGRLAKTALAHARGQLYNKTASLVGEYELVGESTLDLAAWLTSAGIEISAVTDSAHIDGTIGRLTTDDLFDRLGSPRAR